MKKLILICLVLVFGLMSLVSVTSATPVDELTALASYAPGDAAFFAAVRTDEALIDTLDDLLSRVNAKVPLLPPGFDLREMLESEQRYQQLRAWLGDTAVVIIPSFETVMNATSDPLVMVISSTDQAAAIAMFDEDLSYDLEYGYYEKIEQADGSVLYQPEWSFDAAFLVTEDVVIIGWLEVVIMPGEDRLRLSNVAVFQDTLAALPEDDYHALMYIDFESSINTIAEFAPMMGPDVPDIDFNQLATLAGHQALGFTLLQNRSLVIDYAVLSPAFAGESTPVDLALLDRLPMDTVLLIEGNSLGTLTSTLLDLLPLLDEFVEQSGQMMRGNDPMGGMKMSDLATFARLSFEGSYGLDLDETLAWMDGDFVTYLRAMLLPESMFGVTVEGGFIQTTNNPQATAAYVAAQARMIQNVFAVATFEEGVLNVPVGALLSVPEAVSVILTSTDDFLIGGTSNSVEYALNPSADSITDTPSFIFERRNFLSNAASLLFVDVAPLRVAFTAFAAINDMIEPDEAALASALLTVIDSASVTTAWGGGTANIRLTLTLGE